MRTFSGRRGFLRTSLKIGASAFALNMLPALSPTPVFAQNTATALADTKPERKSLKIAHNRDLTSASLFVAEELGFSTANGIGIKLQTAKTTEDSLTKLRDGKLDAVILPATLPLIELFKQDGTSRDQLITSFMMGVNSAALTIRPDLYHEMVEADREAMAAPRPTRSSALLKIVNERKRNKQRPLRFGVSSHQSEHELMLRYWLAEGGVDPDNGVEFLAMSGPLLVASLKAQAIDGFLAHDPWCSHTINKGFGYALVTAEEIWSNSPAAALVVTLGWAEKNPNTHKALLRTLSSASQWSDGPGNRGKLIEILSKKEALNTPRSVLDSSLRGDFTYINRIEPEIAPDFAVFNRYAANYPWRSDAVWYLSQLTRWGYFETAFDMRRVAQSVYRPDIFRDALSGRSDQVPLIDFRSEGSNFAPFILEEAEEPFVMGVDSFVDGRQFNPSTLTDYLSGFEIHNLKIDLSILSQLNG